jgi:mannitol/fructose-specific phosphotransferase system IIA component (Ntr-type)
MKQMLEVSSLLSENMVLDLDACSKPELLEQMLAALKDSERILDFEQVRKAIFDREKTGSTGIGSGFAVPHARTRYASDFVISFARIKAGVDFDSEDGNPVTFAFLIVASDTQDKEYIRLLSRLMLRLRNPEFVRNLHESEDSHSIYQLFLSSK